MRINSDARRKTYKPVKAEPKKAEAKKESKKNLIDRVADKNDGNGVRANGVKSIADVFMLAKGGRDVRTEKLKFGNTPLPLVNDQPRKTVTARNTPFTRTASGVGGTLGVAQLPFAGASMVSDIRAGFREGWDRESKNKALGSTASFASVGLNTVKGFAELREARQSVRDVTKGFRDAIDKQANGPRLTAPGDAAAHHRNTVRTKAGETAKAMAQKYLRAGGDVSVRDLKHVADSKMKRAVANGASKAMASDGLKAAKLAGRAGGRFVPGVNVAIAAADTAAFVSTLRDPKASVGKKVTAGITAAGSALAATNIPVVSQVGGVVSTVSSVVGAVGPEKIGNAVKDGAKAMKDGAKSAVKKLKFW
ncbi:hypothetical protein [Pyxidicoccus xibeiensis]|uniref:hypothetical protein n=1 Tax=Pyxidicoccus xibeiensis TaxID=2906759 RepID=UPI0020A8193D|nr:hypothetical protein [Pyxidicoccus xibeiensis]MCP3140967.1 hypothetical protein [Pyxidicoccus xibeiensis]